MAFAAVGLPLLLLTTACAQPGSAREPQATASFAPDLTQFHDQQLAFEPCAPYATTLANEALFANERFDCARMQVPLDYADPDGPRAEIALLRMKARGERIGSLVVNPGGPGGSGMRGARRPRSCCPRPPPPQRTGRLPPISRLSTS